MQVSDVDKHLNLRFVVRDPSTTYSSNHTGVEYKCPCYLYGVLIIRGFLLSVFHIFTNATNYLKLEVQLPPNIKQFQTKSKIKGLAYIA